MPDCPAGLFKGLFAADPDRTGDDIGRAARILYTAPEQELRFFCGEADAEMPRGRNSLQVLLQERKQEPERIEEELKKAGVRFVAALEERFPQKLKEIPDPPFGIYYKGRMPEENEPAAAIIGARLASGYGREQARRFGRRIGARGIAVISGMARGIDGIAQKAALDAGGKSYAVLGCGVDICYPEENRELYEQLLQEGGVLSEYPPGTFPDARLFPPRNRIISGLSDLVLVIEARKKSGTLITVDMALEQGREVYVVFSFYKWNILFIKGTYSKISKKYPNSIHFGLPTYLEHTRKLPKNIQIISILLCQHIWNILNIYEAYFNMVKPLFST